MYKKILVPLDGSQRAEAIMPHVEDMAARYGATIVLIQVIEPALQATVTYGGVPTYHVVEGEMEQLTQQAQTYLDGWKTVLANKGLEAKVIAVSGPIVPMILRVAEKEAVDLLAMSSHGRTGLPRVFYGSVAAGVLNQTELPLLLVRSRDDDPT